jgi:DNA-binding PadR family transcriptional regulator
MPTGEVLLALLRRGPGYGYDVKRDHDAWFPGVRPLAYGQVYATLARLERDGLVEVAETRAEGGPERTVYSLTEAGRRHLDAWLAEPAPVGVSGADEIVRKTVAAVRTGTDPAPFLAAQRAAHLRRIREIRTTSDDDLAARLARDHVVAHLDADLRWLDLAAERLAATRQRPNRPPDGRPRNAGAVAGGNSSSSLPSTPFALEEGTA